MKKILAFLILSVTMVSCYEDYIFDNTYSGIYFPYQLDVRTFVVGEGMKVEVGASLGGVRKNTINRNVNFILDNSLLTPTVLASMKKAPQPYIAVPSAPVSTLLPLPASYYTLSNSSTIVIKEGQHVGTITVKPDSATFLADAATANATYALPFYITDADADSVIQPKRSAIISFRYENMLFGKYWHGGSALVNRPGLADTTVTYYTSIPMTEAKVWVLNTTAPDALYANGYLDQVTSKNEMKLTLDGNKITVSSVPGSTFVIQPEGESSFNRSKLLQERKIFLKYMYTNTVNGFTYHCTDTIAFRNRIRDGVNEWQDENPSHYTK
jgi:hypothetical protein